ncbi:MAG: redoxin domain-containing protein [Hahellaceae bacterium]|nr:redoxin domain-containing protein [Hahellaceae bacterium]MCP5170499.1 redoxin domain-containing protein [Hahellaceae bacterium]
MAGIFELGVRSAWTGALVSVAPMLYFFVHLFLGHVPRTTPDLMGYRGATLAGVLITLMLGWGQENGPWPLTYSVLVGAVGMRLYIVWYSRLGRQTAPLLQKGNQLPAIEFTDISGAAVSTESLRGAPALLLFFRGNWCPLCMAQIREISEQYRTLASLGVKTVLISPQPHENTQALAKRFDVPFEFWTDKGNQGATQLGINAVNGTPKGLEVLGYDSDTVMPTVLVIDEQGRILFADLTDNYRVRPEPETFIAILREHRVAGASE